ncbi:hypothetical protein [Tropicimonas sp. S265A]|uniref:hypothetical protein n=1 Tax=Tropicimonas sp. S265A TaxID=3415134 RepID=UPI003C7E9DA9
MFVFTERPKFTHPVTVEMPTENGMESLSFIGRFQIDPDEEFLAAGFSGVAGPGGEAEIDALMEVFIGWDEGEIGVEGGGTLEPTDENIRKVLAQVPTRLGVARAYVEATRGGAVRQGNSLRSPGTSGAAKPQKAKQTPSSKTWSRSGSAAKKPKPKPKT